MHPGHFLEISVLLIIYIAMGLIIFGVTWCLYYRIHRKGLSKSQLRKLPKVTGKDLVMGADCCAVCLDEIESDQSARMIPGCNHGFHLQCADVWLAKDATCPICRAKITSEFFRDAPAGTNPGIAVAV